MKKSEYFCNVNQILISLTKITVIMAQQNDTIKSLLLALIQQHIPEMGELNVDCSGKDLQDLLWFMFHFKSKAPINLDCGLYIYQYDLEDGPTIDGYTAKLTTVENDIIYLYKIS